MNDSAGRIEEFRNFAQQELDNHLLELQTRYQDRELASNDLKNEAYDSHRQIFKNELLEKIETLVNKDNQFLRSSLDMIRESFVDKLRP